MTVLGDRLRELRQAAGLSQEELARRADVLLGTVQKIEQGIVADPRWSSVTALARALGVTLDALAEPPVGRRPPRRRGRPPGS